MQPADDGGLALRALRASRMLAVVDGIFAFATIGCTGCVVGLGSYGPPELALSATDYVLALPLMVLAGCALVRATPLLWRGGGGDVARARRGLRWSFGAVAILLATVLIDLGEGLAGTDPEFSDPIDVSIAVGLGLFVTLLIATPTALVWLLYGGTYRAMESESAG